MLTVSFESHERLLDVTSMFLFPKWGNFKPRLLKKETGCKDGNSIPSHPGICLWSRPPTSGLCLFVPHPRQGFDAGWSCLSSPTILPLPDGPRSENPGSAVCAGLCWCVCSIVCEVPFQPRDGLLSFGFISCSLLHCGDLQACLLWSECDLTPKLVLRSSPKEVLLGHGQVMGQSLQEKNQPCLPEFSISEPRAVT